MNERVKLWDFVLIALLIGLCLSLWFLPKEQGNTVTVSVDGTVIAVKDLNQNAVIDLSDGTQVLIENRTARVIHSTCPDHLCEEMGKISSHGQVILCVPNRISVEIRGEGVDALVG